VKVLRNRFTHVNNSSKVWRIRKYKAVVKRAKRNGGWKSSSSSSYSFIRGCHTQPM